MIINLKNLKSFFSFTGYKSSVFRPLGAGLTLAIPLLLGLFLNNPRISSVGVMGSFAYLIFQEKSFLYNFKMIFIHGVFIFFAFFLGLSSTIIPWSIPFFISGISFGGFLISKIYRIPKPDYFFVIMIYVTGSTMVPVEGVWGTTFYILYGLIGSLVSAGVISLLIGLPFTQDKDNYYTLSFRDKYKKTIELDPQIILKAIYFSMILFCSAYVYYLLRDYNGHWILISSAAILAAEQTDKIKIRSLQRGLGSVIGLLLGMLLISFSMTVPIIFIILIIFSMLIEYYIPRNYVIANFFTNPQVLLITSLSMPANSYSYISHRLSGLLIGTFIVVLLVIIEDYGFKILYSKK